MSIKLGLSVEVDVVPPEDHALVFLEVDIDHLLLRHYIIIRFISQAYLSPIAYMPCLAV